MNGVLLPVVACMPEHGDGRVTIRRCFALVAGTRDGARTVGGYIDAIYGAPRASTARRKRGTGSGARSGAASTT